MNTDLPGGGSRPSESILVVEDSAVQVRLTRMILEREGYRVDAARDGRDALDKLQSSHYDLILLDVDMPELNGFQVMDRLKADEKTRSIPIIMLTAHAKDAPLFGEMKTDADAFMAKPMSPELLLANVRRMTGCTPVQAA